MLASSAVAIRQTVGRFRGNDDGAIAIIFGASVFFLIMATGLAIDVGRIMLAERTISAAVDAAALAAAKGLKISGLSDAETEDVARRYFEANMQGHGGDYTKVNSFDVAVNRSSNSVSVSVDTDVPTLFANIAGFRKVSVPKSSSAIFDSKELELGVQLDVTGSMSGVKIRDLKDAVAGPGGMLDILLPDNGSTNTVRIGLAPFAAGVNAGRYAGAVSNGRAGADGCVYERLDSSLQDSDSAPIGSAALKVAADLPRGVMSCPSTANVVALTDDKSMLRNEINGWTTGGATAGHLGASWAWGLVSPEWASIWGGTPPAPYGNRRTQKFVILMTDGIYNTVGGQSTGDNGASASLSRKFADDTCTAMKAKGIVVYTIGFQVPNSAKSGLRQCASGSSKFFDATDGDTLRATFRAIAEEINNLRLSS